MRARLLVLAATAVVAAALPADATCIGCGGAAAPGAASVAGGAAGTNYPGAHTLKASCSYSSTPSAGTYVAAVRTDALATSTYGEEIAVNVACYVLTSGGSYSVSASRNNRYNDPTEAYAWDIESAKPLEWVHRICLSATASWSYGSDGASFWRCVFPGFAVAELDVVLPYGS